MHVEWRNMLYVLQKYLTYKGRYATTLNYHILLLLHFEAKLEMNFPYFLYKSLAKMSRKVQKHYGNAYNSIYHHGLVKILIEDELHLRNDSWVNFVERIRGLPSSANPHSPHILVSPQSKGHELAIIPDPEPEPPLI